jgi:hypothetical protein
LLHDEDDKHHSMHAFNDPMMPSKIEYQLYVSTGTTTSSCFTAPLSVHVGGAFGLDPQNCV